MGKELEDLLRPPGARVMAERSARATEMADRNGSVLDADDDVFADPEVYEAYRRVVVGRQQLAMEIRGKDLPWVAPAYRYLLFPAIDGEKATNIQLIYTMMTVDIKGRNLAELFAYIKSYRCPVIWEFDAGKWKEPADKSAAIITSIKIVPGMQFDSRQQKKEKSHEDA